MNPARIMIVSGEPSGDLHAAELVNNMKKLNPGLQFYGIGGELSRAAGVETLYDIKDLSVVGAIEVVRHAGPIRKAFTTILEKADKERPALAILVDYPGFNLRLAKALKKRSIPVAYYISPQVWAWGANRISLIKEYVRRIFVLFKFEEELYKRHGVDAEFIGNPLMDTVRPTLAKSDILRKYGLSEEKRTVCLLTGSRTGEMRSLLGPMLGAAKIIEKKLGDVQFIVSKFKDLPGEFFEKEIRRAGLGAVVIEGDTYNALFASDFAIVASGTATLETALIGTPFIITYKTNPVTWMIAKRIVQVKYVGIVNIVAGRQIVPEVLQYEATPENLAAASLEILGNPERLQRMKADFTQLHTLLGPPGASSRAAASILNLLKE